ncbi:MAG: hypothetical protein J0M25_00415 [Flavobacteriales bacterium]|nr:hypothetical protein [Flavobacteriales bacterium]
MNKKILFSFLLLCLTQLSFACYDYSYYKYLAKKEKKLIVIFFIQNDCPDCGRIDSELNLVPQLRSIIDRFVYFPSENISFFPKNENPFKIYNIIEDASPKALLVDASGEIIKRFDNIEYSTIFLQELQFYTTSTDKIANGFKKFNSNSVEKLLEVAEGYYIISHEVNDHAKSTYLKIANQYVENAKKLIKTKSFNSKKVLEKLALMQLYHDAFSQNFQKLALELSTWNEATIHKHNLANFYFLKLVVSQTDDEIAKKLKAIDTKNRIDTVALLQSN